MALEKLIIYFKAKKRKEEDLKPHCTSTFCEKSNVHKCKEFSQEIRKKTLENHELGGEKLRPTIIYSPTKNSRIYHLILKGGIMLRVCKIMF